MVALLVWFFTARSEDRSDEGRAAIRAITVLVVTCPGALLIAYPTAMVAAFAAAARLGIMIKQTRTLEVGGEHRHRRHGQDRHAHDRPVRRQPTRTRRRRGRRDAAAGRGRQSSSRRTTRSRSRSWRPRRKARIKPRAGRAVRRSARPRRAREDGRGHDPRRSRGTGFIEMNPSIEPALRAVESRIEGMSGVHVMLGDRYLGAVGSRGQAPSQRRRRRLATARTRRAPRLDLHR